MNTDDILGTQNWEQSKADPFLAQKIAIFGKYLYVDNVDEISIRFRIFRICAYSAQSAWTAYSAYGRMANPTLDPYSPTVKAKVLKKWFFSSPPQNGFMQYLS